MKPRNNHDEFSAANLEAVVSMRDCGASPLKSLAVSKVCAINEAAAGCAGNTPDGLTETLSLEDKRMAAKRSIAESRHFSTENQPVAEDGKWRSIGDLASGLKAEINAAIASRDEGAAADAHDALVDLEHRARVVETVRRCCK